MTITPHTKQRPVSEDARGGNIGLIVLVVLLVSAFVAIVAGVVLRREPDFALVLATPQDCLRAFDDAKCREIVSRALAVHAESAPRFGDQRICELDYGDGGCTQVSLMNAVFFAPAVAAIVIARGANDDPAGMVPLYFEAGDKTGAQGDGRRVFFHGLAIGILHDKRFGGAAISVLTDLQGKPLTSEAVRRIRRS